MLSNDIMEVVLNYFYYTRTFTYVFIYSYVYVFWIDEYYVETISVTFKLEKNELYGFETMIRSSTDDLKNGSNIGICLLL